MSDFIAERALWAARSAAALLGGEPGDHLGAAYVAAARADERFDVELARKKDRARSHYVYRGALMGCRHAHRAAHPKEVRHGDLTRKLDDRAPVEDPPDTSTTSDLVPELQRALDECRITDPEVRQLALVRLLTGLPKERCRIEMGLEPLSSRRATWRAWDELRDRLVPYLEATRDPESRRRSAQEGGE